MIAGVLASNDFQALALIVAVVAIWVAILFRMEINQLKRELRDAEDKIRRKKG